MNGNYQEVKVKKIWEKDYRLHNMQYSTSNK